MCLDNARSNSNKKVRGWEVRTRLWAAGGTVEIGKGRENGVRCWGERLSLSGGFDLASNLRLLPKFNEHDPDVFFSLFETMSEERDWPMSIRIVMLQTVITGKAQEAYAALMMEDRKDYNKVKIAILKAYELVPEAYRQRFRSWRKGDRQTHSEVVRIWFLILIVGVLRPLLMTLKSCVIW